MLVCVVIRYPVPVEPPEEEECRDIICIQSTVINPDQENLRLSYVVRTPSLYSFLHRF